MRGGSGFAVWLVQRLFEGDGTPASGSDPAAIVKVKRPAHLSAPDWARPFHICTGTGLAPSTSAPGLGSPDPCLHRVHGMAGNRSSSTSTKSAYRSTPRTEPRPHARGESGWAPTAAGRTSASPVGARRSAPWGSLAPPRREAVGSSKQMRMGEKGSSDWEPARPKYERCFECAARGAHGVTR